MARKECVHHWKLAPAWASPGGDSVGACIKCGAKKRFSNWVNISGYKPSPPINNRGLIKTPDDDWRPEDV